MATLQEAAKLIRSIQPIRRNRKRKKKIVDELLGKFKGIVPEGKTSSEYIRELRETLYGKVK